MDPEDARRIWSTLQVFLGDARKSTESETGKTWYSRAWFVVPYDANGLKRLWNKDPAQNNGVGESFLDKSFQFRFEVPPLALSNWRDDFCASFCEAFPKHHRDAHEVYRVVSHCLKQSEEDEPIQGAGHGIRELGQRL